MGISQSGVLSTSVVSGIGSDWPRYSNVVYNAVFNEMTYKWNVSWYASAQGGVRSTAWTQCYYGEVSFYKSTDLSNPVSYNSFDTWITAYQDSLLLSGSFEVDPETDGTLSLVSNAYFRYYYNSEAGASSYYNEIISLPSADIGSKLVVKDSTGTNTLTTFNINNSNYSSGKIKVEVTSSGDYYHIVKYGLDSSSATALSIDRVNKTTSSVNILCRDILLKCSENDSILNFYIETYKDSNHTQKIGITSIYSLRILVTASGSNFKPYASGAYIDIASTPINGRFVAGKTKAKLVALLVAGNTPATISKVEYTVHYGSISTVTGEWTDINNMILPDLPESSSNYTISLAFKIVNSRRVESDTYTSFDYQGLSVLVYGYSVPIITSNIYRVEGDNQTNKNESGEWLYFNYSANCSSVDGRNTVSVTVTSDRTISGLDVTAAPPQWAALDRNYDVTFTLTAVDTVGTEVTSTIFVTRAVFPLIIHDDLNGNVGVEINGFAEQINPADTETMYTFKSGNKTMSIGIDANGNMGIHDGSKWLLLKDANGNVSIALTELQNGSLTSDYKMFIVEVVDNAIASSRFTFTIPNTANTYMVSYTDYSSSYNAMYMAVFEATISSQTLNFANLHFYTLGYGGPNAGTVPSIVKIWGIK